MSEHAFPVLHTLFLWWFSTGLIVYLDGLPTRTFRWSLMGAGAIAAVALYVLAAGRSDTTVSGAYIAFTAALAVWGWNEISFLMGLVTGPRRLPCPPGAAGWERLRHAVGAVAYHEISIAVSAVLVAALTWGGENQIGLWTFLLLWAMRLSAKINVYLGVANLGQEFLPDHLKYLASYFRKRPMNAFFPLSVTASTLVLVPLIQAAGDTAADGFTAAGFTFLATLMALALLEHWLMVLPLPAVALWSWYLAARDDA
ncbi:photosynthetic complex assembly protein 2 [Skermanella stibiiresistens SB22]|uniref:Photosynthetic complex assembly protein 2 n=1 Tax=Skermanella stibiiresistens SB22 TaxID=1385369 RepID=W9H0C2_9PROT|nr:putative photosynthetic complex assembly protein PuhE [Skermanella stibiiresistens]EWY39529.1 photosynthetic complex assembly protein 2 [Skermanella stibiiresistens SB22]